MYRYTGMDVAYAVSVFVAIFAIVNPVGNISFFTTLTRGTPAWKNAGWQARLSSRRHPAVPGGAEHALRRHAGYQDHARREGRGAGAGDGRRHPRGHPDAGPGAISIVMLYMSRGDLFEGGIVFAAIAATMAMSCSAMPMSSSGEWEQRTRWPSPGSWVSFLQR